MEKIKPVYKKLLVVAAVIYVIGTALMLSDIYYKIGCIDHYLEHMKGKANCPLVKN